DVLAALGEGDLGRWESTRHAEIVQLQRAVAAILDGGAVQGAVPPEQREVPPRSSVPPTTQPPNHLTTQPPEPAEPAVRVTAGSVNRLMSLAGESLVQARWLQPFAASLLLLKKEQDRLAAQLATLAQGVSDSRPAGVVAEAVTEVRGQAARCRQMLAERIGEFERHAAQAEDLNSRLYREVIV